MEICPNKFFCFNRDTFILIIVVLIIIVIFYVNLNNSKFNKLNDNLNTDRNVLENKMSALINIEQGARIQSRDPRLQPPVRKLSVDMNKPGIPINIKTRGEPTGYQQVGVLMDTDASGGDAKKLLPLYGQETYPGSNQWNYYTASDGFQSVKLGVIQNNKDCQDHNGCSEIYDGGNISVNGYSSSFKANIYKLQVPRYIPHII